MAMASIASCAHTSRCQFATSSSFSGRRRSAGPIVTKVKIVSKLSAPGREHGRAAAILATRRGMRLFAQVLKCCEFLCIFGHLLAIVKGGLHSCMPLSHATSR